MREDIRLSGSQVDEIKGRNPIMPEKYDDDLLNHVDIVKPDLTKQKYL